MNRIGFLAILAFLVGTIPCEADTQRYRLTWRTDPATTMVVGWEQDGGNGETVHYDTVDHGQNAAAYAFSRTPDRNVFANGMAHRFARLDSLQPDTAYYFVISDSQGVSERMWFKTAPDSCADFSIVAGGDSRDNQGPRQDANVMVSKLRPLFVYFGGDYVFDGGDAGEMQEWLDDWQLTQSADGRMYPIVATRGNHESNGDVRDTFDSPTNNIYFALSFGGTQLRTYTLNSEIVEGGNQANWLANDLATIGASHVFKMAQYHKPMRPHTDGKSEGVDEYDAWAQTFYNNRVDLVVECDSHLVKRTWPVRPFVGPGSDEGFIRDDAEGTVYVGEGGWGAPTRNANDAKDWTRASGSFDQVQWIHVTPSQMQVRTIETDRSDRVDEVDDADPLALPAGLNVWSPGSGDVVTLPARNITADTDGDGVSDNCDVCPLDFDDDSDGDSVCDSDDTCPGGDDLVDADGDSTPDDCDLCEGFDDAVDADSDTVPDGCDACPGGDDLIDTDLDTTPDDCDICAGEDDRIDTDLDTTPDGCDLCEGADDRVDTDADTTPDGCDVCEGFDDRQDEDGDTRPDGCDVCPGADDLIDGDGDTTPDGCDVCPGFDDRLDDDADTVPNDCDQCAGFDDLMDVDGDMVPDGCDACPDDNPNDTDGDGVCESADLCPAFDDAIGVPANDPGPSLRTRDGGELSWEASTNATGYPVHRGTIPALGGMGSRPMPYDHTCLVNSPDVNWTDPDLPGQTLSYYYLVGAANPCGLADEGLGSDSAFAPRPVPLVCP